MLDATLRRRLWWMSGGVVLGLVLGGLWPNSPVHATATSQIESFAVCTAPIDEEGEGVFFLDYLTGELKGAALSPMTGKFNVLFGTNVAGGLGIDVTKSPKYLLVSGVANFRRAAGSQQMGGSVLYVAELTSGKVAAFGIPWNRQARAANAASPLTVPLTLLDTYQFRNVQVRSN
jgi:hypothetical protein